MLWPNWFHCTSNQYGITTATKEMKNYITNKWGNKVTLCVFWDVLWELCGSFITFGPHAVKGIKVAKWSHYNSFYPVLIRQGCGEHLLWETPPTELDDVWYQRGGDCLQPVSHSRGTQVSLRPVVSSLSLSKYTSIINSGNVTVELYKFQLSFFILWI